MKPIKIDELPPNLKKQVEKKLNPGTTVRNVGAQHDRSDALEPPSKDTEFHEAVHITITVWRTGGNWDADNIETKAIIDGLVAAGVLSDDTIKEVPVITRKGYRCYTRQEEKTTIEVKSV